MSDAAQQLTLRLLTEGGGFRQPVDTRTGPLYRPQMGAAGGGYAATLETLYDYWIDDVPDPDEAVRRDPKIRERIRFHPDVQAAMRKRELTVASLPWRIEPNEEAENRTEAEFVAKYVEWAFKQIADIPKLYMGLQQAVLDGGVGAEFRWHKEANGVERPVAWHAVHKSRFCRDRQGNLALRTRTQPVWGSYVSANPNEWLWKQFPHGKFIYHVYRQLAGAWDEPGIEGYQYWGVGEDVALYYLVTFDIYALKYRMKYLERFASPPADIYFPDNGPYQSYLRRIADSQRGESVCLIPRPTGTGKENDYFTIKYREIPTSSYDHFASFSDQYTLPRVSSLILGSSDEMHRSEHGGYSDQVARQDSGPNVIFRWDAANISETLNKQLISAIAWSRFPNLPTSYLPVHKMGAREEKDREQEVGIVERVSKLVAVPESAVYDAAGISKPQKGEKSVGGQQQGPQGAGMPPQGPPGSPQDPKMAPLSVPGAPAKQKTAIGQLPPQVPHR